MATSANLVDEVTALVDATLDREAAVHREYTELRRSIARLLEYLESRGIVRPQPREFADQLGTTTTDDQRIAELKAKVESLEAQLDEAREALRRMLPMVGLEEATDDA